MKNDTVTQMWETRPPRIPKDQGGRAHVAGVCEGIGVRYQIDPTLVRVLFVVTTLAVGGGIAAYLLAWMCMPRYGMSTAPVQAVFRDSTTLSELERKETGLGWTLLVFFVLFSGFLFSFGDSWLHSTSLVAIGLLVAAWYGLHQHQPTPPAGLIAGSAPAEENPRVNLTTFTPADPAHEQPAPPAWDPLGAASFAWDLPEPPPREEPKPKTSIWKWVLAGFAIATLLLLVLGAAAGGAWYVANGKHEYHYAYEVDDIPTDLNTDEAEAYVDLEDLIAPDEDTSVTLTSTGHPLEVKLPEETRTTLICDTGPTSNCEEITINDDADGATLTLRLVEETGGRVIVDHDGIPYYHPAVDFQRPTSEEELLHVYERGVGRHTVDFRQLPALDEHHDITISNGVGPITVLPPAGPWEISCESGLGDDECPSGIQNPDADGKLLSIQVENGIGPIHVVRK